MGAKAVQRCQSSRHEQVGVVLTARWRCKNVMRCWCCKNLTRCDGWSGGFFAEPARVGMLQGMGFFLLDRGVGYGIKLA
jgi:hypothetical protein